MFEALLSSIREGTGLMEFYPSVLLPMFIRGIITYFLGITLTRFNKTLMGIRTPFNFILFMMLGSLAANAVVDRSLFIPILATLTLLTLLNGFTTALAYFFPSVEYFIKGSPVILVKNGKIQWQNMRRNLITKYELINELHSQLHTQDIQIVKLAILASDGTINFTLKD
jgi:uncharacterized membrane protein YcaP (DUF421 family)